MIAVTTAAEMRDAVLKEFATATAVIMAAAVADYRPVVTADKKIKRGKDPLELRLEPNPDIVKELGQNKDGKMLIGFAAETEDLTANAAKKLREKNLDMIVANNVTEAGSGFRRRHQYCHDYRSHRRVALFAADEQRRVGGPVSTITS